MADAPRRWLESPVDASAASRVAAARRPGLPDGWREILDRPLGPVGAARRRPSATRLGELADELLRDEALGGGPRLRAHRRGPHGDRRPRRAARARARRRRRTTASARSSCAAGRCAARRRWPGRRRACVMDAPGAVDGEAHHGDGPVMVKLDRRPAARRRNPRLGRDVVLHEFAHKLDMLDGTIDGTPPIDDDAARPALDRRLHGRVRGRARRRRRRRAALLRRHQPGRVLRRRHRGVLHPPAADGGGQAGRCTRCWRRSTARTPPSASAVPNRAVAEPARSGRSRTDSAQRQEPPGSSVTSIGSKSSPSMSTPSPSRA